jgi:hypothetical protein
VGADELAVTTLDGHVVEKRVPLPARWLRGLAEVAARAATLDVRMELPAAQATALVAGLSSASVSRLTWLVPAGRSWRSASRRSPGAVCVADGFRLTVLRPLLPLTRALRLYGPVMSSGRAEPSGWELDFGVARFTLLLSDALIHGFAGDGQLLGDFGSATVAADSETLAALLAADPVLDRTAIADRVGWHTGRVGSALAALATAGQVGYDQATAAFYHRPLPFRADLIAGLHPRLAAARLLASAGTVVRTPLGIEVTSGAQTYLVHQRDDGYGCTCTWWATHHGRRGPCKHVVAAIVLAFRTGEADR